MDGFDYSSAVQHNGLPLKRENPDDGLIVIFRVEAVKNQARSEAMGCPQFDEQEMVRILAPGDKNELYDGKIRDRDKTRFEARYNAWKEKKSPATVGYPIEQWPPLNVAMVAELKANNVFTVENICDVTDSNLRVLGLHGRKLRDQAKDFMARARGEAPFLQLRTENANLQERILSLEQQNRELMNHLRSAAQHDPNIEITAPTLPQPTSNLSPQVDLAQMVAQAVAAALAANQPQVIKKSPGRPKKIKTENTSEESN